MLLKGKSQAVYVTQRPAITIRTAYYKVWCKKDIGCNMHHVRYMMEDVRCKV